MKILVINPGSTSTKLAVFEDENPIFNQTISHETSDLAPFRTISEQLPYRIELIRNMLSGAGYTMDQFDAVSVRGGFFRPVEAGTYRIDENVVRAMRAPLREHASNLGSLIAWELVKGKKIPAFFVDPVSVDEITDIARVTGLNGMERPSFFHALNQRCMARKAANMLGKTYNECNFIISHLGGGISTVAHKHGRAVEISQVFDEGCFSMDRAGSLPVRQLVELCFSGKSKEDILDMLKSKAGIVSYLGTRDFRVVERRAFEEREPLAKLIFDAFAYQLSRDIGSMAAVLCFEVDAVILTGGMAHSKRLTDTISQYVGKIAPIIVLPGENEMLSLAQGALRVLRGEEEARIY